MRNEIVVQKMKKYVDKAIGYCEGCDYTIFSEDMKLYFFDSYRVIIATNGFVKKQQRTPKGEIDLAKKRRADYFRRKEAGTYE